MFCCCQEMGNLGRKRKGKQHVAKVTPTIRRKQQTIGASSTKMKQHIATRRKVDDWVQNMTKIATDAGILPKKGTAYGEGEAVIIVRIVYNMVKRRAKALKWGNPRLARRAALPRQGVENSVDAAVLPEVPADRARLGRGQAAGVVVLHGQEDARGNAQPTQGGFLWRGAGRWSPSAAL